MIGRLDLMLSATHEKIWFLSVQSCVNLSRNGSCFAISKAKHESLFPELMHVETISKAVRTDDGQLTSKVPSRNAGQQLHPRDQETSPAHRPRTWARWRKKFSYPATWMLPRRYSMLCASDDTGASVRECTTNVTRSNTSLDHVCIRYLSTTCHGSRSIDGLLTTPMSKGTKFGFLLFAQPASAQE